MMKRNSKQGSARKGQAANQATSPNRARTRLGFLPLAFGFMTLTPVVLMTTPRGASAQVLYGTLTGNATDPSGAAIPGATVVAKEIATGVEKTATTTGAGLYSFTDLNPGTYQVTITASGFAPTQQNSISILPNTSARIDLQLKVGNSTEEVTVTTAPPELQTDTAQTDYNISQQQITELPTTSTTGRNFQSLYRLIPGSTPPAEQNSAGGNPQRAQAVNVNGVSNATNTTRIDGAVDAYPWLPYLVAYLPPTDGIDSINVVTGSFNAEQGSAGGSAINVTIKSGTNHLHGSAWAFNSIAQLNAQSWSNRTGVRQKNIYNEDGASIGGPILKDKLFFFFDYDRVTVNKAINGTLSVPTLDERAGNFAALITPAAAANGTYTRVFDPSTGTATGTGKAQFNGNMIPTTRFSTAAKVLLANLPAPNQGGVGAETNNYFGSAVNQFNRQNYDGKVTYIPTQKTSFFGHYSASPDTITDPQVFGSNPGGGTYDGGQPGAATGLIQNIGLGATHAFTPNFAIDANAGYTRQRLGATASDIALGDYGVNTLGIPGTNNNGQALYGGIPGFYFTTFASLGNANTGSPFTFRDNQYTGNVNASYVKGPHALRFGGEYLHAAINHIQPGTGSFSTGRGSFQFTGGATEAPEANTPTVKQENDTAALSFADFLIGQADVYNKSVGTFNPEPLRYSSFAFFGQDTWQASKKLTINYGLRYEYYPLPVGDHFGTVRYDPSVRSTVTTNGVASTVGTVIVGGENGIPQHANTKNGWGQIVPRLGISYRVNDKTVVRSGFGFTTDPDTLRNLLQAYPASVSTSITGTNGYLPADSLNAGLPSPVAQIGIPTLTLPNISAGLLPLAANLSTNTIPANFRRGYIESYNLAVQHEFTGRFVANITYAGTHSVRQQSSVNINAAPPTAPGGNSTNARLLNATYGVGTNNTDLNSLQPFQGSVYNGLQTQLTRTSEKHGSTGIVYTYSKAMDASDNSQASGLTFAYPTYWNRNWALAGYDRKHNFQWWTTYNLPFGSGQYLLTKGVVGYIVGNWRVSTILSRVSGTPFTVTSDATSLNAPGNTQVADQNYGTATVIAGRSAIAGAGGTYQYLNPAAFSTVRDNRFGTTGRNSVRGPGIFDLDVSLKRSFPIKDGVALDFVADSFDITNTPQFANPASNISASGFGQVTTSNANRSLRLSGRISF